MSVSGKFVTRSVLNRSFTEYPAMVKQTNAELEKDLKKYLSVICRRKVSMCKFR